MMINIKDVCQVCNRHTIIFLKKRNICEHCYRISKGYKSIESMHKKRFGGMRDIVLQRDNYTCQMCGMTNTEHKERWNREITIDHINMMGRYSKEQDNSMSNLHTLCLRCHGKKDRLWYLAQK